jgi:hypothetical protein
MKDQLIADLVANERCPLTAEELEGFEPERLQQLAEVFAENEEVIDEGDETLEDETPTGDVEPTFEEATVDGIVARMDSIEARGLIPVHPNCRCGWAPYIPELQRNMMINTLLISMLQPLLKKRLP